MSRPSHSRKILHSSSDDEFRALQGIDLSHIDLDQLEEDSSGASWSSRFSWLITLLLLTVIGFLVWLPSTPFYFTHQNGPWLMPLMSLCAVVTGLTGGRWLLLRAIKSAEEYALHHRPQVAKEKRPSTPLSRAFTLGVGVIGAISIVFGVSTEATSGGGSGLTLAWFATSAGGLLVGITMVRWLFMQQDVVFTDAQRQRKPWKLPPWFRWVTLAFMVLGSLFILLANQIFTFSDPKFMDQLMGGLAFTIGITAAVWMTKRFDETDKKIRGGGGSQ